MKIVTNRMQYSAPQIVEHVVSTESVLCQSYSSEGEAGPTPSMGDEFNF